MSMRNWSDETMTVDFGVLKDKTLKEIKGDKGSEELILIAESGEEYRMVYYDDCCAGCSIEEIHGDLSDLIGTPILMAEEVSSTEPDEQLRAKREAEEEKRKAEQGDNYYAYSEESETWTFYKLSTIKGSVTIRWYGSSNGYYSERPTFELTNVRTAS